MRFCSEGGQVQLLADLVERPSHAADGGSDVAGANFLFGQVLFVHEPLFHQDGWPPRGVFGARSTDVVSVASSIPQDGQLGKKICQAFAFLSLAELYRLLSPPSVSSKR